MTTIAAALPASVRAQLQGIAPKAATHANVDGDNLAHLAHKTVGEIADAANLGSAQGATVRFFHRGEEYTLTISRPRTVEQAVRERASVTGYLTLAKASDELPQGKARFSIYCEDPTPEGTQKRQEKANEKLATERAAQIRQVMREHGWSRDDSAHWLDQRNWIPGVSEPIPDGWRSPANKVLDSLLPLTGAQPADATQLHTLQREDFIQRVRADIKAGRMDVYKGSQLIEAWDTANPAPSR